MNEGRLGSPRVRVCIWLAVRILHGSPTGVARALLKTPGRTNAALWLICQKLVLVIILFTILTLENHALVTSASSRKAADAEKQSKWLAGSAGDGGG